MHLPPVLRTPITGLIGETCYDVLIENLNLTDVPCIKYTISKGLGLGIVLGGSIVKIPQIMTIIKNKSAQGLSMSSYLLETLSYAITLAYNLRQGNPFSTYGEIFFISIQNILITLLILVYSGKTDALVMTITSLISTFYCLTSEKLLPAWIMAILYAGTIPLSLASKIPQINANFKNKSTGQLSAFAVINYFAGSTARVFTTLTELDDPLVLTGTVLASILNAILVVQVFLYWGAPAKQATKPIKTD
ncbi:monosaccharide-p-dolichol utilization protein [Phycomyces nitens]|nr:monosaccharide-p-dolichol utilization protein [Phycomyces nitens]